MRSTKWTYHKEQTFTSKYFIFSKVLFSVLSTSHKELIWIPNHQNAHIYTFGKCWGFIWGCLFHVSILKNTVQKQWRTLSTFSVNMTKFAVNSGLNHIYWRNLIQNGPFRGCSPMKGKGWAERPPFPKICYTYPTMMKSDTVIPCLKTTQKTYQSRDTPLEFCRN